MVDLEPLLIEYYTETIPNNLKEPIDVDKPKGPEDLLEQNKKQIEYDVIILATGYRAKIEDILENGREVLDKYNVPKQPIGVGVFKGLYFVGFDNYKLGGILGTIFTDSKIIVDDIRNK